MSTKEHNGDILPSYEADGNGNQPRYPRGAGRDTEMPDFFHDDTVGADVIDITEARQGREVSDSKNLLTTKREKALS